MPVPQKASQQPCFPTNLKPVPTLFPSATRRNAPQAPSSPCPPSPLSPLSLPRRCPPCRWSRPSRLRGKDASPVNTVCRSFKVLCALSPRSTATTPTACYAPPLRDVRKTTSLLLLSPTSYLGCGSLGRPEAPRRGREPGRPQPRNTSRPPRVWTLPSPPPLRAQPASPRGQCASQIPPAKTLTLACSPIDVCPACRVSWTHDTHPSHCGQVE